MRSKPCKDIYSLNEETLKDLESSTWPQIRARVRSQNLRSEYLGCDDNGRLYFKTTSGTTPGKWWKQQIEFKDLKEAIKMLNQKLFMRRKLALQMLIDGNVSLWCLIPGTLIQMADGTQKRIESINPGDMVITHTGAYRRVLKVSVREVNEDLISIKSEGHVRPVVLTKNHKLYAFKVRKRKEFRYRGKPSKPSWVLPTKLTKEDHLCLPVIKRSGNDIREDYAFLLGAYIGDGNIEVQGKNKPYYSLRYTYDTDEQYLENVYFDLLKEIQGRDPRVYSSINRKNGATWKCVMANGGEFPKYVMDMCGKGLENKHLPYGFEGWSERSRLALLAGLWVTDGDVYSSGMMKFDSSKFQLHNQVKVLLQTLGIRYHVVQTGRPGYDKTYGEGERKIYRLELNYMDGKKLYDYLVEHGINENVIEGKHFTIPNIRNGYMHFKIQDISSVSYEGPVYNLLVEEDNSYIANDVIVHNCEDYSWHYFAKYVAYKNGYGLQKETRAPTRNNVQEDKILCKHLLSCFYLLPSISDQILRDYKKKKILPNFVERMKSKIRSE